MDETPIDGVKFSEFSSATPGSSDEVVGLHNGENARFSLSGIIQLIRQGFANIFVPVSRTINGKSLNSNISLDAADVGARPDTWIPTAADVGARPDDWDPDAEDVPYDNTQSGLMATDVQAAIDELVNEKQESITVGSITLSSTWSGAGPFTQTVVVSGANVTTSSKIDLQPTAAQIASLLADGVQAFLVVNNSRTLTAYAVGAAPLSAMTIQCTVEETA